MDSESTAPANEQVIRTMFEAYSRGDDQTLRQVLAEDVIYHLPGRSAMAGEYRGRDSVLQLWNRQKDVMGGRPYRVAFGGMLTSGDQTILLTRGQAEGRGRTLAWRGVNEYTVRDGTVAECRVYVDDLYAFDAFWSSLFERAESNSGLSPRPDATDPRAMAEVWTQALTAHDLEGAVSCFASDYRDTAPARQGESVVGREEVRKNFAALFQDIPDLRAELLSSATEGNALWMEWRMSGIRRDGNPMEFVGVNIFGMRDSQFAWGRIYTELVRDAGGIDAQIERMTAGDSDL